MPPTFPDERKLWAMLTKQLFRGGVDNEEKALLNAPRQLTVAQPTVAEPVPPSRRSAVPSAAPSRRLGKLR